MLLVVIAATLITCGLVFWAGTKMLTSPGSRGSGTSDALGNFIDVFDPARSRADLDLKSHKNMGEVLPSPDDDDDHPVWKVDLHHNQVRIPRQR